MIPVKTKNEIIRRFIAGDSVEALALEFWLHYDAGKARALAESVIRDSMKAMRGRLRYQEITAKKESFSGPSER